VIAKSSSVHRGTRFSEGKPNENLEGIPNRFALWVAIIAYCILAIIGRGVTWEQKFNISHTYNGGSVSFTIEQDMDYSDESLVTLRTIKVKTGNTSAGTVGVTATTTALNGSNQDTYVDTGSTPGTTTSSSFTHAKNSNVTFQKYRVIVGQGLVVDGSTVYVPNGTTVTYKVSFEIPANNTTSHIRYAAYQGETFVGSFLTSPGAVSSVQTLYGLASNAVVTLKEEKSNLIIGEDGSAYFAPNTFVREVNGGTTPVQDTESTSPASVTSPTSTTSGGVAPTQNTTTNNYTNTVIWSSESGSAPIGGSTQAVTDSLYKEGTGHLVTAINGLRTSVDQVKDNTQAVKDFTDVQIQLRDDSPSLSTMQDEAADGIASMNSALARDDASFGTVPTQTGPALLSLDLPVIGLVNLDPATHPALDEFLDYVKLLFGWFIILQFHWWAWDEFKKLQLATFTFRQATGNPVLGGTGAQATGFAAAIAITVILVAIPASYWSYATSDDVSALATNPFSSTTSIIGAGLYLLSLVCPYQLILVIIAEMLVVRKAGVTILAGANIAIKHITL